MCNNRILSIYNSRIVSSLVEHTHVNAKVISKVNSTSHCTFIRADCH